MLNDFAIGIRRLQKDKVIERAMTVDCDVHQGNGTAAIFAGDHTVYTLSIHQVNNYPYPKPPSTLDIDLRDAVEDAEYLQELEKGLDQALSGFQPDLMFYVAGADPYQNDQLGGLRLSLRDSSGATGWCLRRPAPGKSQWQSRSPEVMPAA